MYLKLYHVLLVLTLAGLAHSCKTLKQSKLNVTIPTNIAISAPAIQGAYGPCEPSIAIDPSNTNRLIAGSILNRVHISEDGGKTWKNDELRSQYGVFGDPVVHADAKGNFYYAHLSDPEKKGWASSRLLDRIVIQKSTDGGKTWPTDTYTGERHPKDQDKHWLSSDPNTGAIYCTWTEFDKYESKDPKDKSRIVFSKSNDEGESWSEPVTLSEYEGDCLDDDLTTEGAVPAAGPNGEVYVCWSWNDKIWFDKSTDGGRTWLQKDIVVADQPGGWAFDIPGITRCNGMPVLVCDLSNGPNRGTLYVNWSDQRNGTTDTDIWIAKSTNGGTSWSKPQRVNDDKSKKDQFLSWMAIDQTNGEIHIVFYDRRNYADLQTDVYLASSSNGAKTFSNRKISESPFTPNPNLFFGDYNCISAHDGRVRPIWTRMQNGKLSVWTALIDK